MNAIVEPTEEQVRAAGNDFFAAQDRLQRQVRDTETAETKEIPDAAEPWPIEPTAAAIEFRMTTHGDNRQAAYDVLKARMVADARRLANVSPSAASEISKALGEASAARARAESLLMDQEAVLSDLRGQILAVGDIRKKILRVSILSLSPDDEAALAHTTLNFWVDKKLSPSPYNDSGFSVHAADLAYRLALNKHIRIYLAPLEQQVVDLIKSTQLAAKEAGIDLRKFMENMAATRGLGGPELEKDENLYKGLWN